MNCEQVREALDDFVNGDISGEEARAMRLHLASCADCAGRLDYREWIEILPVLDEEIEPSEDFAARFQEKLRRRKADSAAVSAKEPTGWLAFLRRRPWQLTAAGALAALLVAGIFLRHSGDGLNLAGDWGDIPVAENLNLLQDMPVIKNLDFLENFEAIETWTVSLEDSNGQRINP